MNSYVLRISEENLRKEKIDADKEKEEMPNNPFFNGDLGAREKSTDNWFYKLDTLGMYERLTEMFKDSVVGVYGCKDRFSSQNYGNSDKRGIAH